MGPDYHEKSCKQIACKIFYTKKKCAKQLANCMVPFTFGLKSTPHTYLVFISNANIVIYMILQS